MPALFRRRRTIRPYADHAAIAVLEYELLYVVPEPDTAAAFAVNAAILTGRIERHHLCGNCRRAFRPDEEHCPDCSDCPDHGSQCSRPLPWDDFDCVNAQNARAQQARWEAEREARWARARRPGAG